MGITDAPIPMRSLCHVSVSLILVEEAVIDSLVADVALAGGRKERGGILLGTRRGVHFHVAEATLPMSEDQGSRYFFRRGRAGHSEFARKRWLQSRNVVDWLGEWHSHPEAIPSPSSIDLASWRQIANRRRAPMLFLILGYHGLWMGIMRPGQARPIVFNERERTPAGIGFAPV